METSNIATKEINVNVKMKTSNISTKEISGDREYKSDPNLDSDPFLDPDKCLLWKLYLGRKDAFVALNNDVDGIVNQCLAAKRHLEAVEDSNRTLKQELLSLRSKYEAILEKNKKDTGIIMRLKDSEWILKETMKSKKAAIESLLEVRIKNKEKILERNLLQDDREKLLFRSQKITNVLGKKNFRHKHLYEIILDENKKYKENEEQFTEVTQQLKYLLGKNDRILAKWLENNVKRDATIRSLQDDMKTGLTIHLEKSEKDAADETISSEVNESSDKEEISQSDEVQSAKESSKPVKSNLETPQNKETDEQKSREITFQKEWLSKKTLFEGAEKQKEHFMDFYMIVNKRMQDLNTEIVNVREWLIDKEAEKREIWDKATAMEKLVSEKRRQKPVPLRTSTDEIKIWIDVQREVNDALRKIAYKCLSVKQEDSVTYSEFEKSIRNVYLNTIKESLAPEDKTEKDTSEEKQDEESV